MSLKQLLSGIVGPRRAVIVHDFSPGEAVKERIAGEFAIAGFDTVWRNAKSAGGAPEAGPVGLIFGLISAHLQLAELDRLHEAHPAAAIARIELPCPDLGFEVWQANAMLDVVFTADYGLQRQAADLFYSYLDRKRYEVQIETRTGSLLIRDDLPWFDLGGPLVDGEKRILPGGEVAYTGDAVSGRFCADGGLLATPVRAGGNIKAAHLSRLSASLTADPLDIVVEDGQVVRFESSGPNAARFQALLAEPQYRAVTEIGISFNGACHRLVHDWPCAANEGYPGVHLGLGGDPEAARDMPEDAVHLDLIAHRVSVVVNGRVFFCRGMP